ncbi:CHAT domain-containing protein [Corynascus similis CBS 632.67]
MLLFLADRAYEEYIKSGDKNAIDMAVVFARTSIRLEQDGASSIVEKLNCLGIMLESRYRQTGEMADMEEAIRVTGQAVGLALHDHPHRATCLNSFGGMLQNRYQRTGEMADLEEAIEMTRKAVESTPHDHPHRAFYLYNLGTMLGNRYERTGGIADLEEAIRMARHTVELIPHNHPYRAFYLGSLGDKLWRRYERIGDMADLEEAIKMTRQAVESTPHDHPHQAAYLNSLGVSLQRRYERTGEMADLEEAIRVTEQAVESTPHDHPDRAGLMNNLGTMFDSRYERTGEMADLEEAIRITRWAVESTPHDHPDRAGCLRNLGIDLKRRCERTGALADLEEAIRVTKQAVESTPHDHPERARCLNNLGVKLECRYERTGAMADLEEAIRVTKQAVESTSHDHLDRAGYLGNLGTDLRRYLGNLGTDLRRRYERTGALADLEEAIEIARQAVGSTPHNHPNRAGLMNNLGTVFESRYELTGEMAHLEEAIEMARQAVESTPHDHPGRATYLGTLGRNLENRYKRTGDMSILEEASMCFYNAWYCQTAIPFYRVEAAAQCLPLLAAQAKIGTAIQLGQDVIDLLPAVNTKLLDRSDQQFVMSIFAGIAADVCSFLLASNRPADALEYLEKGRAVIIGQLVDARSDLSSLEQQHPDIARRYVHLRNEVNTPVNRLEKDMAQAYVIDRRREAVAELNACIREIRGIAGNERFLLGQTAAEMQECAVGGTIVVVNITKFRSDAILVSQAAIKTLNLPRLLASDALVWLDKKWTGREVRRRERPQKNREYLEYLAWLWDVCAKPILDEVRSTNHGANGFPRIWWIGTGLGSSMPFHAAGVHSPGSTENVFSRAISSYTPSIKALGYAQHRSRATGTAHGSLLIATMPTTPARGLQPDTRKPPDLPGVLEEKKRIANVMNAYMSIQPLDLPSIDQVVDKLQDCRIVHFACHGYTDHIDPSNSGLILQKQGKGQEAEQDRLTVHRISELSLPHAYIAYLSACSTAENSSMELSDEVIHVVSGFQVAGFPHVEGCLWPSLDRICADVASKFYQSLQGGRWDGRAVAWAVREAVLAVREAEMEMPLAWAQFVHFGA